jgi:hypothetical protein
VVTDAVTDPRTLDHPLVRGELGLRFYAAAPIVTTDGHHLGTVTAIDAAPWEQTEAQTTVLAHLADQVAQHLELRLATLTAIRAERELRDDAEQRAAAAELATRMRAAAATHATKPHPEHCQLGAPTTSRKPSSTCDRCTSPTRNSVAWPPTSTADPARPSPAGSSMKATGVPY